MFDQLKDMVLQYTQKEIAGNTTIDPQAAGKVAEETGSSLLEGIQGAITSGNFSEVLQLAKSADISSLTSQPIVQSIIKNLSANLTNKVGIDGASSSQFASTIIPQLLSGLFSGKEGGFNITDLLGSLTGDNSVLDQNKDGKLGIDDAIAAVKNGSLGDLLGGFFKK